MKDFFLKWGGWIILALVVIVLASPWFKVIKQKHVDGVIEIVPDALEKLK